MGFGGVGGGTGLHDVGCDGGCGVNPGAQENEQGSCGVQSGTESEG